LLKVSAKISVSKFWNIDISGQSNIGSWANIGGKNCKISVSVSKKIISVGLEYKLGYYS